MRVEVDVLGSPSLNSPYGLCADVIVQELCESRGGRPGFPVPNSSYGLCGRKETLKQTELRSCVKVEVDVRDSPSVTVRSLGGREATLKRIKPEVCPVSG